MRFVHTLESFSDGACARQPLHTEPRQCVGVQPWACPGPLQGQMHPVQWSAGLVEPALGAVLGCAGGLRGLRFCHILETFSDGCCAPQTLRTEPRQRVSGQLWGCPGPVQGQIHPVQWSAGVVEPALEARLGLAGGLRGFRFCDILESFSDGGCARQPLRTEPRQCVGGQHWACPGPLQGQMHPVTWLHRCSTRTTVHRELALGLQQDLGM